MMHRTIVIPLNPGARNARVQRWVPVLGMSEAAAIPALLLLHVLLGPLMGLSPLVPALHIGAVTLLGVWWAVFSPKPEQVTWVCAYIAGAEVMWRMAGAPVFWEYGKYSVIGLLLMTLVRTGRFRGVILPFLFFALLLPSSVLPLANLGGEELRKQVSFNLSGPLALAVCTWFFSQMRLSAPQLQRVFLALICPIISIASSALFGILVRSKINFNNSSNFATSGGFGPNQVSAMLGLGALAAFLWMFHKGVGRGLKITLLAAMLFLMAQSALTFSRGGLYAAGAAAVVASFYLIRDPRTRAQFIAGMLVGGLVINFLILPQLDEFTTGALSKRFTDTRMSGRDRIILSDLEVFNDHMLFGVGPGQARLYRQGHNQSAAHTEFSRLLAEHGLFGLAALLLMLGMALRHLRQAQTPQAKAISIALTVWSFLCMASVAMRTVSPAFIFGLTAATLVLADQAVQRERVESYPNYSDEAMPAKG